MKASIQTELLETFMRYLTVKEIKVTKNNISLNLVYKEPCTTVIRNIFANIGFNNCIIKYRNMLYLYTFKLISLR